MSPPSPEESRWLVEHLIPHEYVLRSWLHASFGSQIEVDDIVQEAYARLLRAHATGTVVSPKAFLFQAARNIALNVLRHRSYTHPTLPTDAKVVDVADLDANVSESVSRAEDVQLLVQAIQALPERCRQVFTLRKIYGLSQREIAERLGISEHTVEVQTAIGVRKCTKYFQRHGDSPLRP